MEQGDYFVGLCVVDTTDWELCTTSNDITLSSDSAVTSQTCDLVIRSGQDKVPVRLSPIVSLAGSILSEAKKRRSPRYAALPGHGDSSFVDLRFSFTKIGRFDGYRIEKGLSTLAEQRAFATQLARHYGRFPFPDVVDSSMKPLRQLLKKRDQRDSPEGRAVTALQEIWLRDRHNWEGPNYDLQIRFGFNDEFLGSADDSEITISLGEEPAIEIAQLLDGETNNANRSFLAQALVGKWVETVDDTRVIADAEAIRCSEMTYPDLWQFPAWDLNYLSSEDETDF